MSSYCVQGEQSIRELSPQLTELDLEEGENGVGSLKVSPPFITRDRYVDFVCVITCVQSTKCLHTSVCMMLENTSTVRETVFQAKSLQTKKEGRLK